MNCLRINLLAKEFRSRAGLTQTLWQGNYGQVAQRTSLWNKSWMSYKTLLAFCNDKHPILYNTLPAKLRGSDKHLSWPQHDPSYNGDMLVSAAQRAASFGNQGLQGAGLGPAPVQRRLCGGAKTSITGDAGVRVDSPPPVRLEPFWRTRRNHADKVSRS